jgi:hypothetical protein
MLCWVARVATRARASEPTVFGEELPDVPSLYQAFGYGPVPPWLMLTLALLFFASLGVWVWIVGRSSDPDAIVYTRRRSQGAWPV